jgi:hypothetical protein
MAKQKQTLGESLETWLRDQGKAADAQPPDLKPQNIFEEFPDKQDIQIAEAALAARLWWWRRATKENCHEIFGGEPKTEAALSKLQIFLEYDQQSAYLYELHARYDDRYQWAFGKPWPLCSEAQRTYLRTLWPTKTTPTIWQPTEQGKKNWIDLPTWKINLAANDSVLVEQFLEKVKRFREQHEVQPPEQGRGVRRKDISFLPIELMDKRYYLGTKHNGSQRSQVSKERRDYEEASSIVGIAP